METAYYIFEKYLSLFDWFMMVLAGLLTFGIALWRSEKKDECYRQSETIERSIICALLVSYLLFTLFITLINRIPAEVMKAEWMPFWAWYEVIVHHRQSLLVDNILNVILFIPIGMLLYLLKGVRLKKAAVIGFAFSAAIETLQLVTRRGLFQWDDMLHNMLGCMIGAGMIQWVCILFIGLRKLFDGL